MRRENKKKKEAMWPGAVINLEFEFLMPAFFLLSYYIIFYIYFYFLIIIFFLHNFIILSLIECRIFTHAIRNFFQGP